MNTSTLSSPAASARTSPYKLDATSKKRLIEAKAELERLERLLLQATNLKEVIADAGTAFAAGDISISIAAALIGSAATAEARHEIENALRRPVKRAIKDAIASVGAIVLAAREHHVAELAKLAGDIEATERTAWGQMGLLPDDFHPSPGLSALREQHRRSRSTLEHPISRSELNALLVGL